MLDALTLASRLTPIVLSDEKERLLFEQPSVYLNVKSSWSVCRLATTISPSENPIATV